MAIKNTILEIEKEGRRSVYIYVERRPELLSSLHHKLRVKSALYGCNVYVYNPDMNFNNALSLGWNIIIDNRPEYVHNIKIVNSYNKKNKKENKESVCNFCGQKIKK